MSHLHSTIENKLLYRDDLTIGEAINETAKQFFQIELFP